MAKALQLAERGLYTTDPNPRVGCVIVKNHQVIAEGWHQQTGGPHAEINALNDAAADAAGSTVYITLEPCCHHGRTPPCTDALLNAKVERVVVAMLDPNPLVAGSGLKQLQKAGIKTSSGVMQAQAEQLNPGFVQRMSHARPYIRCKVAMSMDGRTAMANGQSQWITSDAARADGHRLRARSSVVMSGIGTILADDPSLTARLHEQGDSAEIKQPIRVILDSQLRLPAKAKLINLPGETWVFTCNQNQMQQQALLDLGVDVITVNPGAQSKGVNLAEVMQRLAEREVNEVLVEAGATINGALIQSGLVDELVLYIAPKLLGDAARGAFYLPGLESVQQNIPLEIADMRRIGNDWRIVCKIAECLPES
jgi:diaminohydroxyphosphoribosylaminopyrimidine deaminase/5-amino-6-(5-phosphoribosylamino)uracil reductase